MEDECGEGKVRKGNVCVSKRKPGEKELYDKYDNWLEELGADNSCERVCRTYGQAKLLKAVDPTGYGVGFRDFINAERDRLEEEFDMSEY